jgi:hypothetical protein
MRKASTSVRPRRRSHRRAVGQVFRIAADLLARRQVDRRRAEPGVAAGHALVGRGVGVHAHQHAFRQHGAVRDVAAVADEAAVRDHGRLHRHPAAVDLLVAQHHGVGNEGLVAQGQHVGHHAQRGRDLGVAAHLGAQQAVPEGREHGRVDAVQDVQARFLDVADQPLLAVGVRVHGRAARLHARQEAPADRRRHQHGQRDQHRAGRQRQHEVARQLALDRVGVQGRQRAALVEPVDQHEAGEDRHEEQGRHQQDAEHEEQGLARQARGVTRGRGGRVDGSKAPASRAGEPPHTRPSGTSHAVGQRRLAFQVAAPADPGIPLQDRIRRHAGVVVQRDLAQQQAAALDARVLEVHAVADADVVADRRAGPACAGHRADHDVLADLRAQQAQPPAVQRGAGQQIGRRRLDQAVGQPPAVIGHAPQRIAAGLQRRPPAICRRPRARIPSPSPAGTRRSRPRSRAGSSRPGRRS